MSGGVREVLASAVRASGQSQRRLAAIAGLSEKHVSQMLTGRVNGALPAWDALLLAADVEVTATARPYNPADHPDVDPTTADERETEGGNDG